MPSEKVIYQQYAYRYDRLIQCEDFQGNILPAIQQVVSLENINIIDMGAGTGRITRLLAPYANMIFAYDESTSMLQIAKHTLSASGLTNWQCSVANHLRIPLMDSIADLIISGWSYSYLAVWGDENWRSKLEAGWTEVQRLIRPQVRIIFLETLGTGHESPNPPEHMNHFYDWLREKSFKFKWIRTDYRFASLKEAEELSGFFFGEEMRKKVKDNQWVILPECTAIWWR